MENAIVKHDPNTSLSLQKVADGLFKSGMFPNAKNAFGAFAIVEYGHELGIPPMMSLKNINIISGQLACNAQLMLSMAMSRGVTYTVLKESDKGAEIEFRRGNEKYTASFTEEDAKAAGLTGKDNWKKYARDMYFWRAAAKGIRRIAPDAVLGLYTKDEITNGEIVDITLQTTGEVVDAEVVGAKPNTEHTVVYGLKESEADVPLNLGEEGQAPAQEVPPPVNQTSQDYISDKQAKRLFALSKTAQISTDQLKLFLMHFYGIEHSNQVPKAKYEEICNVVGNKEKFAAMIKEAA